MLGPLVRGLAFVTVAYFIFQISRVDARGRWAELWTSATRNSQISTGFLALPLFATA